jgi:hypothetical protein
MKYLLSATLGLLGTVALTASASAAIVCNEDGWKTAERLTYPPEARITIYDDDYAIGPKYRMREVGVGRGYYRGGAWVGF